MEGLIWHVFDTTEFEKLEAYHRLDNPRSGRVLEKSPMTITDMVARFGGCPFAARGKACYCVVKNV